MIFSELITSAFGLAFDFFVFSMLFKHRNRKVCFPFVGFLSSDPEKVYEVLLTWGVSKLDYSVEI